MKLGPISTPLVAAVLTLGCATTPDDSFEGRSFADMHAQMLRGCEDAARPCPLVLLDTRPVAEYTDAHLAAVPGESIDYIDVTKGACLVEWRFGVTGYAQVIEVYTRGFEGERLDHAPMPMEYEMMCEFEGWRDEHPGGRTVADAVTGAFGVCLRLGRGCPLVLIDTRSSAEFSREELDAMPLSSIVRLDTTTDECTRLWRYGERGRHGAIEIYTEEFEGETLRHEEMLEEERVRCRADASQRSSR